VEMGQTGRSFISVFRVACPICWLALQGNFFTVALMPR